MEGIFLVVQLKEGRYLETRKTFPYKDYIERQKSSLMSYTKQRVEKKNNKKIWKLLQTPSISLLVHFNEC